MLLDFIREKYVDMPKHAQPATIAEGVASVKEIAQRLEADRRENFMRNLHTDCEGELRGVRFKRCNVAADVADIRREFKLSDRKRRRPPDLTADNLTFSAQLLKFVKEKCNGVGPIAYKRAGLDRRRFSRIVSDNNAHVEKETVMRFVIGLQLSRPEADRLMKAAGYCFSTTEPVDCAFLYCMERAIWNIEDVEEILAAI